MKCILSEDSYAAFKSQGFVRTGLMASEGLLDEIRAFYRGMAATSSNWNYFETNAIARADHGGRKAFVRRLVRSVLPWAGAGASESKLYEKSIYGSTELLPRVLTNLLESGLQGRLGDVPFLAAHDIWLEGTKDDHSFGFHDDGFGWDIFFQTGDDLTIYIALQDMNETTGGRLRVERHPEESVLFEKRNRYIQDFAQFCKDQGADVKEGRVTRQGAESCRGRRRIAGEYHRLAQERRRRTRLHYRKVAMSSIDMVQGEVILFNNKLFHDVEPWKLDSPRSIYIVRCLPLYEMGLSPPVSFLNQAACNRYLLDASTGEVRPIDLEHEALPFFDCPDQ